MIVTELRLLIFLLFIISLITRSSIFVDAIAGRCYLCSQNTLAECAGNTQPDSPLYNTILQYYTEPCNGQCVLFRNENTGTIRGCSWTYGHMTSKSTGWHELSPGIQAYFCDTYLCNNGTFDQPEKALTKVESINNEIIPSSQQTLNPQQLFILAGNTLPIVQTDEHLPSINTISHQLRQCYSCTARLTGCGEYLDPLYVSKYIRPCTASCIIFRNPNDHNLITRDCSISWPQVNAKSGLHKLLGTDAFFCQESLCNGISFDFIMGIFHNKLPAVLTFPPSPPSQPIDDIVTTTPMNMQTMTDTFPIRTTINIDDSDDVIWDDPDLDFVIIDPTTTSTISIDNSISIPFSTELPDDDDDDLEIIYESTTIPLQPIEHFDLLNGFSASSTIAGGAAVAQQDSQFNWWDVNEASLTPFIEPNLSHLTTTLPSNTVTIVPSTNKLTLIEENDDEWAIFNTSSIPIITDSNSEIDFNMNDYFTFPTASTIETVTNNTLPINPFYFSNHDIKEQLSGLTKPIPTLAMPPFSWMLHLAKQNQSILQSRQAFINKTSFPIKNKKKNKKKRIELKSKINNHLEHFYDYCNKKQCQHGGRLNSDCLCICLPSYSGTHCEIVHCNQEPAHICDFVLDHECKSDYVRYLCPRFCQMTICSSTKST
ncbi:unnamed protein product [Adineta steineri]|uniref:EGF-like domain-containing protein n=1 Tax=Adineta steineri TaxID=433720 RepID=A0A819EUS0_9BILA|nr:unnamed protein product [Adineta steineri]